MASMVSRPHAGDRENTLDDEGAAQNADELTNNGRDDHNEAVPQGMAHGSLCLGQAPLVRASSINSLVSTSVRSARVVRVKPAMVPKGKENKGPASS